MQNTIRAMFVALLATLALAGCGGGGAEARTEVSTVSEGQQLLDLKKAYDAGAMSKDEYERARTKILNR